MFGPVSNPEVLRILILAIHGLGCGLLWDLLRAFSHVFSWNGWKRACADLAFWMLCCLLLLGYLYTTPEFGWRLYDLIALLLGCILYFSWFSKTALKLLLILVNILRLIMLALKRTLHFFLNTLFAILSFLCAPFVWIGRMLQRNFLSLINKYFPPPPENIDPPPHDENG